MPTCSRWLNCSSLTPCQDSLRQYMELAGAQAQPGLIQGAAHDVYEAEAVLNHKLIWPSRSLHYLVDWQGYLSS